CMPAPPEPECTRDSKCSADYYSDNYCMLGDVYSDFNDFSCIEGKCAGSVSSILKQDCGYGCENGVCLPEPEECTTDEQCEEDYCEEWQGGYCLNDDVYKRKVCHDFSCVDGECAEEIFVEEVLEKDCDLGCEDGLCILEEPECTEETVEEDCGEEEWSFDFCMGDDLYSTFGIPTCHIGRCLIGYIGIFNQTCLYGCQDEACLPEPVICDENSDCGNASSELVCVGDNVKNKTITPACTDNACASSVDYDLVEECPYGCEDGECEEKEEEESRGKLIRKINLCGDGFCDEEKEENELTCPEDCEVFANLNFRGLQFEEETVSLAGKTVEERGNFWVWLLLILIIILVILSLIVYKLKK
ncbi:MAG: hypothetical protein AABX71_01055, partial [Nanoarchaeota archaeon]